MTIPQHIIDHLDIRAEEKLKAHATGVVRLLSIEVQQGEFTIANPTGGNLTINAAFVDALQTAIIVAAKARFQEEEVDKFLEKADKMVPKPAEPKGDK